MIRDLWLIGIGTGNPSHLTLQGQAAIRDAAVILVPDKGEDKQALSDVRRRLIEQSRSNAQIITFDYPERDPDLPYSERVEAWHDEIARRWEKAAASAGRRGPVALLVWGDPSLYDSTIRIAERLSPRPAIRVVPGITSIQALTAAHAIPLNVINGPVYVTTGRRMRDDGWPQSADTVVVMLDAECSFRGLDPDGLSIWWGAYLGSEDQALVSGSVAEVGERIETLRAELRARHGWIMDTYLLRRANSAGRG